MKRRSYPSDLSEQELAILEPLIPPAKPGGHPRTTEMREVLNAILYLDRTYCQWRALPHEFPPWPTVLSRPTYFWFIQLFGEAWESLMLFLSSRPETIRRRVRAVAATEGNLPGHT